MENYVTIRKEKDLEIAKRIRKKMKDLKLNSKNVIDMLSEEVPQGTFAKWVSENPKINNGINLDILKELANILNTSIDYLLYGENDTKKNYKETEDLKKIDIVDGYVGAGSSGNIERKEISDIMYISTNQIQEKYKHSTIYAIKIIGDSMIPYVSDDDFVLYVDKPLNHPNVNNKYIISTNGNLQLKNISFRLNGDIIISSENKTYPDEIIKHNSQELENFSIIGIIVGRVLKN